MCAQAVSPASVINREAGAYYRKLSSNVNRKSVEDQLRSNLVGDKDSVKNKYHGVSYPWCFNFDLISRGHAIDTTGLYVRGVVSFYRTEAETQYHRHEVSGMG